MRVDSSILLSRLDDVDADASPLAETLADSVQRSKRVTILSAYYGVDYLRDLLANVPKRARKDCRVTLVFGVDQRLLLARSLNELRELQADLSADGFINCDIRLYDAKRPFHVKLYHVLIGTQPSWFVGSANASSAVQGGRHELMLRLRGAHGQLSDYVAAIIKASKSVSTANLVTGSGIVDVRSFLSNGSLAYRPQNRLSLTFEACRITPQLRRILNERAAGDSGVPFAAPKSEGFGFDLARAVEDSTDTRFEGLSAEVKVLESQGSRVGLRRLAAETNYGFWLPAAHAERVTGKLKQTESVTIRKLEELGDALRTASEARLWSRLEDHVTGLKALFAQHGAKAEVRPNLEESFAKFRKVRTDALNNPHRLRRLVHRLYVERMPDIWNDTDAALAFEDSFFEDVAFRMSAPTHRGAIAEVLTWQLELDGTVTPEALRASLEDRLEETPDAETWFDDFVPDDEPDDE